MLEGDDVGDGCDISVGLLGFGVSILCVLSVCRCSNSESVNVVSLGISNNNLSLDFCVCEKNQLGG